jgi:hypothetical protein
MLSYSGATADTVVRLRIKGAVRYALSYAQRMSSSDVALASAALKAGTFGWQTTKVTGGEIQQTITFAEGDRHDGAEAYANQSIRDGLFMSNHIANGYNDAGMTATVSALCASFAWTCDGSVHRQPLVQHFVGWIATTASLFGQPHRQRAGIDLGWGYAHEMGHNTCSASCASCPTARMAAAWVRQQHPGQRHGTARYRLYGLVSGRPLQAILACTRPWRPAAPRDWRTMRWWPTCKSACGRTAGRTSCAPCTSSWPSSSPATAAAWPPRIHLDY